MMIYSSSLFLITVTLFARRSLRFSFHRNWRVVQAFPEHLHLLLFEAETKSTLVTGRIKATCSFFYPFYEIGLISFIIFFLVTVIENTLLNRRAGIISVTIFQYSADTCWILHLSITLVDLWQPILVYEGLVLPSRSHTLWIILKLLHVNEVVEVLLLQMQVFVPSLRSRSIFNPLVKSARSLIGLIGFPMAPVGRSLAKSLEVFGNRHVVVSFLITIIVPTFFIEDKRILLSVYANIVSHQSLFIK